MTSIEELKKIIDEKKKELDFLNDVYSEVTDFDSNKFIKKFIEDEEVVTDELYDYVFQEEKHRIMEDMKDDDDFIDEVIESNQERIEQDLMEDPEFCSRFVKELTGQELAEAVTSLKEEQFKVFMKHAWGSISSVICETPDFLSECVTKENLVEFFRKDAHLFYEVMKELWETRHPNGNTSE